MRIDPVFYGLVRDAFVTMVDSLIVTLLDGIRLTQLTLYLLIYIKRSYFSEKIPLLLFNSKISF
jgi:hypothetical protein